MSECIRTRRLILRPFGLADAPGIVAGVGDYSVARYLSVVPHPYTLAMAHDWLARLPDAQLPGNAAFAIELEGKGLIGCVTMIKLLGFWIAQPFWGQGFMTEAAAALLHWHFDGAVPDRVVCGAHQDNRASLAVQRKLGFVQSGRGRRFAVAQNCEIEHIDTAVTRAAFKAAGL